MKKFSELKEDEKIYIFYDGGIIAKNINKIHKFEKYMIIKTDWCDLLISDVEKDFLITEADVLGITEAIATSMDRLLLEVGEE